MSLPNKIPGSSAPTSRDRRGVAAIANFPGNSPILVKDSSTEIRVLVEQAQQTAHALRAELHKVEKEKEELGNQLAQALISVDELRAGERELRSQFVEVTSLIRERDAAQKLSEQNTRA